jgi:diacylglycerol kinase family enzyme
LAAPTTPAQDGTKVFITAGTAHAHTIKTAANGINGAKDTVTFAAVGDGVVLEAVAGAWIVRSLVGGTALSEV